MKLRPDDLSAIVVGMREPYSGDYETGGLLVECNKWFLFTVSCSFMGAQVLQWVEENCAVDSSAEGISVCLRLWEAGFFRHTFERFKFSLSCFFFWRDSAEIEQLLAMAELSMQGDVAQGIPKS